jgi:sec-independent protein translocase protein TatB
MFGVSLTELIVIFLVALILFGPEQLPEIARQLGKLVGEFRRGSDALKREFYNSVYPPAQELKRDFEAEARQLRSLKAEVVAPPPGSAPVASRAPQAEPAKEAPASAQPDQAGAGPANDTPAPPSEHKNEP